MPLSNFLHSSCFNIPGAPQQLPAFIWFYIWFHRGLLKSPPPVPFNSTASRIHAVSISRLPLLVPPQLLACTVIWVQYLGFRFSSQQLLVFILVSMSNFPLSHLPLSHQFFAVTWLQYLHDPLFLSTPSCMHLVSISKFPPPCASQLLPAFIFGSQKFPLRLSAFFWHVSSCIFI